MPDPVLTQQLAAAARRNNAFFKFFGVFCGLFALGLVALMVFVPPKPGEEAAMVVIGGFILLIGGCGPGFWIWSERRSRRLMELATEKPTEIAKIELVAVARGHSVLHYGLWITDRAGRRVGTTVPDQATAQAIVAALRAAGAQG